MAVSAAAAAGSRSGMGGVAAEIGSDARADGREDGGAPQGERPLGAYSALTSLFGAGFAGAMGLAVRHRGGLPPQPSAWDVATVGIATHKLTRLVAKARVTSSIRAPFVRYEGGAGRGEVSESPQGTGFRRAVGELLVCPHCLAQWVAGGFTVGLVAAPRMTRLIAAMYTAQTISDFLQIAYKAAEEAVDS